MLDRYALLTTIVAAVALVIIGGWWIAIGLLRFGIAIWTGLREQQSGAGIAEARVRTGEASRR